MESSARRRSWREFLKPSAWEAGHSKLRCNGKPKKRNRKAEVESMKRMALTVALVGTIVVAAAVVASADVNDSWITTMNDVKVASVNNGVVLLSGKTDSLTESLRAIENAHSVKGVHRVASELQTVEN
jgi:hypothetical protein